MIVNYTAQGWEIVTQRAHGLLAAKIANQWHKKVRGTRWFELLLAIAEHDDAQVELENEDLLTESGGPVDFKMRKFENIHCSRTIDFALSKSRYVALLCSMHLTFIYKSFKKVDRQAAIFIKEQLQLQNKWRKELKITLREAQHDYRLMEWCDALSLLLCQHEEQPESRTVQISAGPDGKNHLLKQSGPGILTVIPWPFEKACFEIRFERRLIPQLSFNDAIEFRKAFRAAKVTEIIWTLAKAE